MNNPRTKRFAVGGGGGGGVFLRKSKYLGIFVFEG